MRQLASIKVINKLVPIKDKDRIELAIIDGWQVIVEKGYKVGDMVVFCEIDSVFPEKPEFEFLRKYKFRIKTMKMAGVVSQGICFPLSILPITMKFVPDKDVTEILGITQYNDYDDEEEQENANLRRAKQSKFTTFLFRYAIFRKFLLPKQRTNRGFPNFISRTDETRIQNIPWILDDKSVQYVVREKLEGQSGTYFIRRMTPNTLKSKIMCKLFNKVTFDIGVCSRTTRKWSPDDSSFWSIYRRYDMQKVLLKLIQNVYPNATFVAIQGECVGPGIQGNIYKLPEFDFYVFNLIVDGVKVKCNFGSQLLRTYGLKWAPLIQEGYVLPDTVDEMIDFATGQSKLGATLREGVVLRNYENNTSFKAVSTEYLLKYRK